MLFQLINSIAITRIPPLFSNLLVHDLVDTKIKRQSDAFSQFHVFSDRTHPDLAKLVNRDLKSAARSRSALETLWPAKADLESLNPR